MECKACGSEIEDSCTQGKMCVLCNHLSHKGMPYRYLRAKKDDFDNGPLKCFDMKEGLYIHGQVGSGKTWLMSALMREQVRATERKTEHQDFLGYSDDSLFVSLPELVLKIKSSMDRNSSSTESGILAKYSKVKTLFFDDIGAERTTDYVRSALFILIERRNTMAGGRTVITSNLTLNELAEQHGMRVASRIAEMCRIVKFSGQDRRVV